MFEYIMIICIIGVAADCFFLSNLYWYDDNESNVGSDGGAGTMRSTYNNLTDNDGGDNQYQCGDSNIAG